MRFQLYSKNIAQYVHSLGDYDDIDNIRTRKWTEHLSEFTVIDGSHPFLAYLRGYFHDTVDDDATLFHAYYHNETKQLKMYWSKLEYVVRVGIWLAWNAFHGHSQNDINVQIYNRYCSELYDDVFHWDDQSMFEKWLISSLLYGLK